MIHLAAIVGGIANFHKLPHTLLEVNNGLYNAVFRAALEQRVERLVYVSSSMVFERATEFPTTEEHLLDCPAPRSAYGFSKLAGEVYCRALHDEHGLPYTICRPFNAYGPGELPEDEPGIAHMVPDVIRKVLAGAAPAADLRLGRADPHAHARGRHRRRHRHRDGPPGRRERGLQRLGLGGAHRGGDRAGDLGGVRRGSGGVRARAPAVLRGGRAAALALGREGRAAARLAGADRPARGDRRHGGVAARAGARPRAAAGERARLRHRRQRLRRPPPARAARRCRGAPRATSSTCSTARPSAPRCGPPLRRRSSTWPRWRRWGAPGRSPAARSARTWR